VREFFEFHPDFGSTPINYFVAKCCLELRVHQLGPKSVTSKPATDARLLSKCAILFWASHYEMVELEYRAVYLGDRTREFFARSVIVEARPFEK
jgi:hypothetical protein